MSRSYYLTRTTSFRHKKKKGHIIFFILMTCLIVLFSYYFADDESDKFNEVQDMSPNILQNAITQSSNNITDNPILENNIQQDDNKTQELLEEIPLIKSNANEDLNVNTQTPKEIIESLTASTQDIEERNLKQTLQNQHDTALIETATNFEAVERKRMEKKQSNATSEIQ